jgi:NitT/TauT family transport system permease protein
MSAKLDPVTGAKVSIWDRIPRWISILGFLLVVFALWQFLSMTGWVSKFILPPPIDVAQALWRFIGQVIEGGPLRQALLITVIEAVLAFVVAAVLGIATGFLVAETSFGRIVLLPFLVAINAAPKVVFAPVFIAALGFGISAKVALGAFIAFFPLLVDTAAGLAATDPDRTTLFRSLRASTRQRVFKLQLPSALPFIFAGLKTAAVLAVIGVVIGEFIGGGRGLGQQTKIAGDQLAMDRVYAYGITLAVLGYLFFWLVSVMERKVVFWQQPHGVGGKG